jgi:CRISPR-associated protein Cas5t
MLRLRVKAPFAAFRPFAAGSYRMTAPFLTPSAAYGLLLNVAMIETRWDDGRSAATVMTEGLPTCEIALGAVRVPSVQTLFQQLHNYPVRSDETTRRQAERAGGRGQKFNIQPIRREYLADLDGYVCLRGNDQLEQRVRAGLVAGARFVPDGRPRYGLPFLGDNSFLLSVLREEVEPQVKTACWFVLARREQGPNVPNPCRLTVWIDRADSSRTVARLYGREDEPRLDPPPDAWTPIRPPESPP